MQKPLRILIADDRTRSRNGLKALLATYPGVEVVGEANTGLEAVNLVERSQPDVVLMDVRMPEMDGLQATRLIKEKWPETRVIVLTIYRVYQSKAQTAGADGFLVKGCPSDELMDTVLGRRRE